MRGPAEHHRSLLVVGEGEDAREQVGDLSQGGRPFTMFRSICRHSGEGTRVRSTGTALPSSRVEVLEDRGLHVRQRDQQRGAVRRVRRCGDRRGKGVEAAVNLRSAQTRCGGAVQ